MEKVLINYLNRNYRLTLSTFVSFTLYNKKLNNPESLKSVLTKMINIFDIDEKFIHKVFEYWCDKETILINNKIVEIQNQIYLKTGKTINIPPEKINEYLNNNEDIF